MGPDTNTTSARPCGSGCNWMIPYATFAPALASLTLLALGSGAARPAVGGCGAVQLRDHPPGQSCPGLAVAADHGSRPGMVPGGVAPSRGHHSPLWRLEPAYWAGTAVAVPASALPHASL